MVVFNGEQVTCNLSLSQRDTRRTLTKHLNTQSAARVSLRRCLPTIPAGVSNHFHAAHSRSCKTHRATLLRHSLRLVLTPGKRSGVFTYGRTSTCDFLLRFGLLPKKSFHYFPVPYRCFGRFCAETGEGMDSAALLCCWWLFGWTLSGFTGVFI